MEDKPARARATGGITTGIVTGGEMSEAAVVEAGRIGDEATATGTRAGGATTWIARSEGQATRRQTWTRGLAMRFSRRMGAAGLPAGFGTNAPY